MKSDQPRRNHTVPTARRRLVLAASAWLSLAGCGSDDLASKHAVGVAGSTAARSPASEIGPKGPAEGTSVPGPSGSTTDAPKAPAAANRKIIYNAQVTLVVERLGPFQEKFDRLIKETGCYVSTTDQSTFSGSQRRATWTVRVPVDQFDGFLAALSRLGELQQSHLDSQDVTQEYYDLEARISNKQQEEKRLLKHLSDSTGKLEDILAVERELSRVRGEIEQMQGRIRYLGNLSALSTVTVSVTEVRDYVPPVRPTFAGQIARTFRDSLGGLIRFGKSVVLFVVAVAPWLPVLLVAGLLLRWLSRRLAGRPNRQGPVVFTRPNP